MNKSKSMDKKKLKFNHLDSTHAFIPVAVETLGAFGRDAQSFFKEVARCSASSIGDPQSGECSLYFGFPYGRHGTLCWDIALCAHYR